MVALSAVFVDVQMANLRLQRSGILDLVEWDHGSRINSKISAYSSVFCFLFFCTIQKYEKK